jgi:hypothetical protein
LAFGHSFDSHLLGGYRFLMRHYRSDAKIFIFGFSRGAYTARILNDMLDWAGLLSADNEEMMPFIWKAYLEWKLYGYQSAYELLDAYRDSVCRGDVSVHFLGLFDTVNSVVDLQAVSEKDDPSSRIIRHAVSIDERRVKFQPLLLCQTNAVAPHKKKPAKDSASFFPLKYSSNPEGLGKDQDVHEVWFPGGHSDVGGGWQLEKNEHFSLSHAPLVWMVDAAQRAGLQFNRQKLTACLCNEPDATVPGESEKLREALLRTGKDKAFPEIFKDGNEHISQEMGATAFRSSLEFSSMGMLHDYLTPSPQVPLTTVLPWKMIEFIPVQRLLLQPDGNWKPGRWPLAMGGGRQLPVDAEIHVSALRRLRKHQNYRPGNAIIGGGGRSARTAPAAYGIGQWNVCRYADDPIRETWKKRF